MNDGIIKDDGTSRLLRSVSDFKSKYPTYDEFADALVNGSLPVDVLFNGAGWAQQPDFLNKASLLKDTTASLFQLGTDAVPDEVLAVLSKAALVKDGGLLTPSGEKFLQVSLITGTYTGTGKYGPENRTTISYDKKPDYFIVSGIGGGSSPRVTAVIPYGLDEISAGSSGSGGFSFSKITWGENSVSWYNSTGASYQANGAGYTYYYALLYSKL